MSGLSIENPAYFERLASNETDHWWSVGMWRIAERWIDQSMAGQNHLSALDVGCGAGGTLRKLALRSEFSHVCGIDPSPSAIALASDLNVTIGSALALGWDSETFDLVTCFDVLQHLPTEGELLAMQELARVLKPGAVAIIRTNGRGLWPGPTQDEQPYTALRLRDLATQAGLIVRRVSYANCLPSIATELLGRYLPGRSSQHHGHPQGRGLRIQPVSPVRNAAMSLIIRAEAFAIAQLGLSLPTGHSLMMLAEKPVGATR